MYIDGQAYANSDIRSSGNNDFKETTIYQETRIQTPFMIKNTNAWAFLYVTHSSHCIKTLPT